VLRVRRHAIRFLPALLDPSTAVAPTSAAPCRGGWQAIHRFGAGPDPERSYPNVVDGRDLAAGTKSAYAGGNAQPRLANDTGR
jgi:hypothetical protein